MAGLALLALAAVALVGCRRAPDRAPGQESAGMPPDTLAAPPPGRVPGRVVFVSERDGDGGEVYAFDGATGRSTRQTRRAGADYPVAPMRGGLLVVSVDTATDRASLARLGPDGRLAPLRVSARTLRNPVVSPDGASVVYEADAASLRDLYRYDVGADRVDRLTATPSGAFDPSLSPDGRRIAYATSREGDAELYVMPNRGEGPGGRDAVRVTAFHRDDIAPRWSPDGARLAFVSDREGAPRLFVVAPDGTGLRRLLAPADTLAATSAEGPAAWAPDARRLAFEVVPASGGAQLWVADAATGARRRLAAALRSASQPAWSPDGRWIALTGLRPGDPDSGADVYAVEVETGRLVRLTDAPGADWLPRWLP